MMLIKPAQVFCLGSRQAIGRAARNSGYPNESEIG